MERAEWLKARARGIGGSDAAAVLGISPWQSRYSLWAEKTGQVEPTEMESEPMEWGSRLEPLVAAKYAEVTGRSIMDRPFELQTHAKIPCMIGTPDRLVDGFPSEGTRNSLGILEAKTTNQFNDHHWDEGAPLYYQVQLQHYLAITGLTWGSFAVLIGGQRFRWYDIERNDAFIASLEEQCQEFWRLVEERRAPETDGSRATARAIKAMHPDDNGETVELPARFGDLVVRRDKMRDLNKSAEAELETLDNEIRAALGPNTFGVIPGLGVFSLKTSTRAAHSVKESKSRRLHWKAGK